MTGKEAIIHYLGTHKSFCAQDVAAVTGATVTSINQAAAKMARAGILVVDGKVWRTVYYRFATREEREGGFAPIFPDICYHLTHYKPAAADIPVASDNPAHYADAIRYNARTPLQGSLLPLTRLVWA